MKLFTHRRARVALALLAALAIGSVAAFAPPGPTSAGEFYYYFDASGNVVGYRALDCHGVASGWGKTSARYSNGYAFCDPVD